MDLKLTVEEHAIVTRVRNHVAISIGGKGNPLIHIHSPAALIDLTRGLCIFRLMASSHEVLHIDKFLDRLEEIFGLPFCDLDPNPYTQEPTT